TQGRGRMDLCEGDRDQPRSVIAHIYKLEQFFQLLSLELQTESSFYKGVHRVRPVDKPVPASQRKHARERRPVGPCTWVTSPQRRMPSATMPPRDRASQANLHFSPRAARTWK